jgi:DNA-binding GntR family transcriptional regulator
VAEGLVEPVRNRGFRVVELTPHDMEEIIQLWRIVEPELTATVAGRLSETEVGRLQGMVDAIVESAGDGDIPAFIEKDREFHEELLSHAGNRRAVELVSRLRDQGRRYGLLDPGGKGAMAREVAADHQAILDAVVTGDAGEVRRLLIDHINRGLVFVERSESAG